MGANAYYIYLYIIKAENERGAGKSLYTFYAQYNISLNTASDPYSAPWLLSFSEPLQLPGQCTLISSHFSATCSEPRALKKKYITIQ